MARSWSPHTGPPKFNFSQSATRLGSGLKGPPERSTEVSAYTIRVGLPPERYAMVTIRVGMPPERSFLGYTAHVGGCGRHQF